MAAQIGHDHIFPTAFSPRSFAGLVLVATSAQAGTFFVRSGASGNGASWANAWVYAIDYDGRARATWDRGAFELGSGTSPPPAAPSGLTAVVH